jgi:hypothetical protein
MLRAFAIEPFNSFFIDTQLARFFYTLSYLPTFNSFFIDTVITFKVDPFLLEQIFQFILY